MKHTVTEGDKVSSYEGIMQLWVNSFNAIRISPATPMPSPRLMAMIQNEDSLDYWLIDSVYPVEALAELGRFYNEQEPWVDPSTVSLFQFVELPRYTKLAVKNGSLKKQNSR